VRGRLTLLAGTGMAVLCLVVNSFVLYTVHRAAVDIQQDTVSGAALRVVHLIERGRLPRELPAGPISVQVVDTQGRVVSWTRDLAGEPRISTMTPTADRARRGATACDLAAFPGRCTYLAVYRAYRPGGDWLVYTTAPAVPWYVTPNVPFFLVGLSIGLVTLTCFGVSRVVARTLAPVDRIRGRLAEITAAQGGMRVPVPENDDEIRALALTANQTLERLEAAAEQQRRFASDASHDLRSPITAMRTQVEEALLHPEETDWQQAGQALLASLDRLQAIVTDLLALARLDAGEPNVEQPVDLAEVVTAELTRPRAKLVSPTLEGGVVVTGDRLRLARLLTNLMDNAERHAESVIAVSVRKDGEHAVLEVQDDGAGIAPDQRETVFGRFTRLDASRNRDAGGTGLGLAIAREIARAHHGTLTIEDSDIGARFVLQMPLRSD